MVISRVTGQQRGVEAASGRAARVDARLRALGLLVLMLAGAMWVLGPFAVIALYEERLPDRLNTVLGGRDVHPLEFYLELAARPRLVAVGGLVGIGTVLVALSRSRWRAAARVAITGGEPGWAGLWRPTALVIVAVAAVLRLVDLGRTSLWLDEAYIANISASGALATIFEEMGQQSSAAPMQHLAQAGLHAVGIWGAAAARLPAALAGWGAVVLLLRTARLGVPRPAAALAAFVLAITPIQVGFSRDATQYGLAILMATILTVATLKLADLGEQTGRRHHGGLIGALMIAPWVAYPVVPAVPAFVLALLLVSGLGSEPGPRRLRRTLWVASAGFVASGALVHRVVAVRQLRVRDNWYLEPHYPGSSGLAWPEWVVRAVDGHLGMVAGGTVLGRALVVVLVLGALRSLIVGRVAGRSLRSGTRLAVGTTTAERLLVGTAWLLLLGAVAAATLRIYPFGPIHQQIHLAPALLLAGSVAAFRSGARLARTVRVGLVAITIVTVAVLSVSGMPRVLAEKEDIVSVVRVGIDGRAERGLPVIDDRTVWVYSSGRPAVLFHFPEREFFASAIDATDVERMADQVESVSRDGRVSLLFSQILPHPTQGDQRRALQSHLVGMGWIVEEEIHFTNTVVLNLIAP